MDEIFERIRAASDRQALKDAFVAYFRSHGVDTVCAIHIPPPGAPDREMRVIDATGYLEPMIDAYRNTDMWEHDPIRKHAERHPMPFFWSEIGTLRQLSQEEREFLAKFISLGARDGLAIPVFGPHGRNGYVSLALDPSRRHFSEALLREFQTVAQMAHQRFCELFEPDLIEHISLSPRETEILTWVARGKSNTIIADILSISTNTVDTHLRRVYEKFDVADRTTAAIRGLGLGLISP